jgi:biopolymer transport protein ExbB/TolQ
VGLFIALIALFAYNYFSYRLAQVMDEMEQRAPGSLTTSV